MQLNDRLNGICLCKDFPKRKRAKQRRWNGAGTEKRHSGKTATWKFNERTDDMENKFIRADDVAQELSVSKPYAYKLIRKLNEELKAQGFITIAGRVNRQYFYERLYGAGKESK